MAIHTPRPDDGDGLDVPDFMKPETPTLRLVHKDQQPTLNLTKDTPVEAAPANAVAPVEGRIVEHQGHRETPAWIQSGKTLAARTATHPIRNVLYLGWAGRGYRTLANRWLDGYRDDYPHMIRTARAELKAATGTADQSKAKSIVRARRADYFEHRWKYLAKTGGWAAPVIGGTAVGAITGGALIDLLMAVAAVAAGAWHGRPDPAAQTPGGPRPAPVSTIAGEVVPASGDNATAVLTVDELGEGKPFPIAAVDTPQRLAECVLRALLAESVPVVEARDVVRYPWGWQCIVRVSEGTPEAIIKAAGDLETRLDLPTGGVRPQPLLEKRACAKIRFVEGDPFASAPPPEYRAPKSLSIIDKARIGTCIDGSPLAITLAGVMALVVAASGGGKTGILQNLGEVTTACRDCITIDLDPHGDGLEDLSDAARLTGRSHVQIEHVLLFLLMLSKARARLRKKLGMGRKWTTSPEHPAIVVLFDEFPKASDLAKKLAFELLLVGRKEAVWVVLASQGGTKLYLGENIAQMLAMQIVGPCKVGDTRAVMGEGSVAEGWLPHRLSPATQTDPKDAGHVYVRGLPGAPDMPVEYKVHEHPRGTLARLAQERREAGLLEPDADSLEAMAGVDLPDFVEPVYDAEGNLKKEAPVELLTWEQLLRLCDAVPPAAGADSPERRTVRHVLEAMDAAGADRMRVETMLGLLQQQHPDVYGGWGREQLGQVLRDAGCGTTAPIGAVDGLSNARGYRRDTLAATL
jgi:hypothetical protein